ncbi:hypothetical protein BV22DRAFT_329936 [Leucogyrophana mollusca]|uniref:Uncharacterized protein n=1 Tax=Leucogyrophana mollusca TaxID=85980 RepID=A0ACB8BPJ4_9AGAM|nr:hypothetical protein BV22DRAFT_329936 [Leucogyrophana mollusca]
MCKDSCRHSTINAWERHGPKASHPLLLNPTMKILSEEEIKGHNAVTTRGALEGALVGSAVTLPSFYYLNRRWPYYRALPLPLKALGAVIIIGPLVSIRAEQRGLEYDRAHWKGAGKMELDREAMEEHARWAGLSAGDKVADWASKHQLSVIIGSWALAMGVAGNIILRDPLQTMPHKVVQVRMWAQGLTIGVLIAAAALTHAHRADAANMRRIPADHSWEHLVRLYVDVVGSLSLINLSSSWKSNVLKRSRRRRQKQLCNSCVAASTSIVRICIHFNRLCISSFHPLYFAL